MKHLRITPLALLFVSLSTSPSCGSSVEVAARPVPAKPQAVPPEDAELAPALPDVAVRSVIADALATDRAVRTPEVEVEVRDGIATLLGRVDDLLAHDHALEIAENARGVRGVVDRLEVQSPLRTDRALSADVWHALDRTMATDEEVVVDVHDGIVTLTGHAGGREAAELASTVARGVPGVKDVQSSIVIEAPATRTNANIRDEVRQRLRYDALIDDGDIAVDVDDGVVTLRGGVASRDERDRARAAAWVEGARDVDADPLRVKYWDRERFEHPPIAEAGRSDRAIARAIEDVLDADPRVGELEIDVDVRRGMATLSGWVGNRLAQRAAERDARNTVGVRGVFDLLRVAPETTVPDDVLQREVTSMLEQDPYFGPGTVQALVEDGTVHLVGTVDDWFERDHAEALVGQLNGVVALQSELLVQTAVSRPDSDMEREIEQRLRADTSVADLALKVDVDDGVVTVRGTVPTTGDAHVVLAHVYDAGAREVRNQLSVESRGPSHAHDVFGQSKSAPMAHRST